MGSLSMLTVPGPSAWHIRTLLLRPLLHVLRLFLRHYASALGHFKATDAYRRCLEDCYRRPHG
jgi:hypothetical protein